MKAEVEDAVKQGGHSIETSNLTERTVSGFNSGGAVWTGNCEARRGVRVFEVENEGRFEGKQV